MTELTNENEALEVAIEPEVEDTSVEGAEAYVAQDEESVAYGESAAYGESEPDYEAIIKEDIATLKAEFPELGGIEDITDLHNPLRYAALRDLGLSPAEAYLATAKRVKTDTRAHLKSAHGRSAAPAGSAMSYAELATARELFPGKNDRELARLYKRVTK